MTRQLAKAYNEGGRAFDTSAGGCPYADDTPEARAWWEGWQAAAELYLLAEFEKAYGKH